MRLLLSTSMLLLVSLHASAQTFEQTSFLQLAQTPMSVRGMAMGSVSIDDPEQNPASIASLRQPLFSVAAARSSFHLNTLSFQEIGFTLQRDAVSDTALSHVYAAVPVRNFVIGAYYRNEPRLESRSPFATAGAGDTGEPDCPGCNYYLLLVTNPAFERREQRYGVSAAWERGPIAIGLGAEVQQLDERYQLQRVVIPQNIPPTGPFGRFDALIRNVSDRDVVPNAGIRWQASPRVALGAAYKGGASFERNTETCVMGDTPEDGCITRMAVVNTSRLKTADSWRASVMLTPVARLQLVGEAVRRNYSELAAEPYAIGGQATTIPYRDVTELHVGAEYRLRSVSLRAGWWSDPAHYERTFFFFDGDLTQDTEHVTLGAGIDLGTRARLDVAYDDVDAPGLRRMTAGVTLMGF